MKFLNKKALSITCASLALGFSLVLSSALINFRHEHAEHTHAAMTGSQLLTSLTWYWEGTQADNTYHYTTVYDEYQSAITILTYYESATYDISTRPATLEVTVSAQSDGQSQMPEEYVGEEMTLYYEVDDCSIDNASGTYTFTTRSCDCASGVSEIFELPRSKVTQTGSEPEDPYFDVVDEELKFFYGDGTECEDMQIISILNEVDQDCATVNVTIDGNPQIFRLEDVDFLGDTTGPTYTGQIYGSNPQLGYVTVSFTNVPLEAESSGTTVDGWNYDGSNFYYYRSDVGITYSDVTLENAVLDLYSGSQTWTLTFTQDDDDYTLPVCTVDEGDYSDVSGITGNFDIYPIQLEFSWPQFRIGANAYLYSGWNYIESNNSFTYFDYEDQESSYELSTAFVDHVNEKILLTYTNTVQGTGEEELEIVLAGDSYLQDMVYGSFYFEPTSEDINVAIDVSSVEVQESGEPTPGDLEDGWNYDAENEALIYYDRINPSAEYVLTNFTYNLVGQEATLEYVFDDGSMQPPIVFASLSRASYDPDNNKVTGYFVNDEITVRIGNVPMTESFGDEWNYSYNENTFIYYRATDGKLLTVECSDATFYQGLNAEYTHAELKYSINEEGGDVQYEDLEIYLYNATYEEVVTRGNSYYLVTGDCMFKDVEFKATVKVDSLEIPERARWEYIDNELVYYDERYEEADLQTTNQFRKATYDERKGTVEIMYGFYYYDMDGSQQETLVFIQYLTAHITGVEGYEGDPEEEVYISGSCVECPEPDVMTLVLPSIRIINPVEPAPEEESKVAEDINTILDDMEAPQEVRDTIDERIDEVPEQTGQQIVTTVENTLSIITTEEQKEIVVTVLETSVVVAANKEPSVNESTTVYKSLPKDSGINHLGRTVDDFYELQLDYLLGRKAVPEKRSLPKRALDNADNNVIDLSVDKEDYEQMVEFIDDSVDHMQGAAKQIRQCSGMSARVEVNHYITTVTSSSFRSFDKTKADEEFFEAVYKAILLHMQNQVIKTLEENKPNSVSGEAIKQYEDELAAVKDIEEFEEIVLEILRVRYNAITGENVKQGEFKDIYLQIFRAWALDEDLPLNLQGKGVTLQTLTDETINASVNRANKYKMETEMSNKERTFIIAFAIGGGTALLASVTIPSIATRKRRKGVRA